MFSTIDGIIWEADADTLEFSLVGGCVEEILGFSGDDWLAQPDFWQSRLHPDDAEWVVKTCLDASKRREAHRLTYRMIAADGRAIWLQDNVKVTIHGDRATLSGIMIDVTELVVQNRQFALLNSQNARFRALYDLVPVAIWEEDWTGVLERLRKLRAQGVGDIRHHAEQMPGFVEDMLAGLRVTSVNRAAVEMFGAETADQLIQRATDVFDADRPFSVFMSALDAILHDQMELEGATSLRRLDGKRINVLYRISLPRIDGIDPRVVICEMDITEAHQANERFELVTRATTDVIWDFDVLNDRFWASEGLMRIFGLDPELMTAGLERWTDRIHPDDVGRLMKHFDEILHHGRDDWEQEYRFRRGDGSYAVVRDEGFILRNTDNIVTRMVGSLVDLTDQRRLEERLIQSQKLEAMGKLTGGIAHDFNNLLTVILGSLESLEDRVADDPEALKHVIAATRAVDRSAELISQLLSYARQQPMATRPMNMVCQVSEMIEMIKRVLGEHIEVSLLNPADLWTCHADPGQFENALLNLCINARDAMPAGGKLSIAMRNERIDQNDPRTEDGLGTGDYVVLSVADTGHGMDPATLGAAFDPFFSTKEVGAGSGLGLSMVQGFAQQSKGLARLRSELGKGTVVELFLPAMEGVDADRAEVMPA